MAQQTNQHGADRCALMNSDGKRDGVETRDRPRLITDVDELLSATGVTGRAPRIADGGFPLRVPPGFVRRMRHGDAADPLLRQVLPSPEESDEVPGFGSDPVDDLGSMTERGLLRKYHGRALLISTGACAIHCRYCFRRHFPYGDAAATPAALENALRAIALDGSIDEVILSGGDPLSLSNRRLSAVLERIGRIDHVRRIRFHTRHPIVLPERLDDAFFDALTVPRKPIVFVVHCNHANEIDGSVAAALGRLKGYSHMLLNQSVLLHGVNDSVESLAALSRALALHGVMPYYLHQLDRVAGAAHFAVSDDRAIELVSEVSKILPGYLVPKLVREVAGEPAKSSLARP